MSEVPYIAVLSGLRRGHIRQLTEKTLRIEVGANEDVRIFPPDGESVVQCPAILHRAGDTYEIEVAEGQEVWVNGARIAESRTLRSGDLLEIGHGGPMLRYRTYPVGQIPHKTMAEMFADGIDGARADGLSAWRKTARFLSNLLYDATTHSTMWFRIWVVVLLTALVISVVVLVVQSLRLQQRMVQEGMRIEGIAELLEKTGTETIKQKDLVEVQREVEARVAEAVKRVEALEKRSAAVARVIAKATPSVAFIQGSFGFIHPETKLPLRYIEQEDMVLFTFDTRGEIVELMFTGTGFIISDDGLMITNRHVAEPWLDDSRIELAKHKDLTPVIQRLWAFLPGQTEPLTMHVEALGEPEDLSLLRSEKPPQVPPLTLKPRLPQPGSQVVVLGYPLGVEALMVRASSEFIKSLQEHDEVDLWTLGRQLSKEGYIKPLATQGIVSQVSSSVIVYDAETALGGSGGPVLNLAGDVVAVNFAVMKEFGGSNLGVPASAVVQLLKKSGSENNFR